MGRTESEMYEGKKKYAADRNRKDKETCDTLTPDQHDIIAWLAGVRHEAKKDQYCKEAWFNDECGESNGLWGFLPNADGSDGEINETLKEAGLKKINWSFDPDDYITNSICYELGMSAEEIEKEKGRTADMAIKFDVDIIAYLSEIDEKHGTHYCPTGIAQFKNPNLGL